MTRFEDNQSVFFSPYRKVIAMRKEDKMKKTDSTEDIREFIRERLWTLQDTQYREFHAKLMPNVAKENIIGIRVPCLKQLAKQLEKEVSAERLEKFLNDLPHKYYEENNLHAFLLANCKDYGECVEKIDRFLPYVDNWATCDSLRPVAFKKHKEELLTQIKRWLVSEHPYAVRFGIEMLMVHFLDDDFKEEYLSMVAEVQGEEYYIRMMVAWYFATALAKHYEETLTILKDGRLEPWTHNKAIQKALESYRITKEKKETLRKLKLLVHNVN